MVGHLNRQQMEELLLSQSIGHLGCFAGNRLQVVPITFAFDGKRIVAHSALGEKVRIMRENPEVCLEVESITSLHDWRTVVVHGRYREIEDGDASIAMSLLVDKVSHQADLVGPRIQPGASLKPIEGGESPSIVFCIEVREMTGRFEHPPVVAGGEKAR